MITGPIKSNRERRTVREVSGQYQPIGLTAVTFDSVVQAESFKLEIHLLNSVLLLGVRRCHLIYSVSFRAREVEVSLA